jgi:lipopolysaccharide transport protein LptA
MKLPVALAFLLFLCSGSWLPAQDSPAARLASPTPKPTAAAAAETKDPLRSAFGGKLAAPAGGQPVTTEIFADEAVFDSGNSVGTFTGRVIVNDPRFNLQADKLTVHMAKGEQPGLQRVVAEGNVGVVRERADGEASRTVARAERAVYTAADGNVELSGSPRVQSGLNTHIATSPDTVMLLNEAGVLRTKGPSRTELRQQPAGATQPPKP